jgi:hypothetical protein
MNELSHEYVKAKITEEMKNFRGFSQVDTPPTVLGSISQSGTSAMAKIAEVIPIQ